jgi:hypothetical protein
MEALVGFGDFNMRTRNSYLICGDELVILAKENCATGHD